MRLRGLAMVVALAAGACACRMAEHAVSRINVADPSRKGQVLWGFHEVETKGSRWASREFAVALKPPPGSARKGARLRLNLFIPEQQVRALGAMTLTADIDGRPLGRETFESGGMHEYSLDVGATLLDTNIVPVRFCFDRAAPPSLSEARELGAVVTDVGLETK